MANKRELKKDINFLATEVLSQGYLKLSLQENVKEEDIQPILVEAIEMRNDFIARVNHPDGKDNKKITKTYFNTLSVKLLEKVEELIKRLEAL